MSKVAAADVGEFVGEDHVPLRGGPDAAGCGDDDAGPPQAEGHRHAAGGGLEQRDFTADARGGFSFLQSLKGDWGDDGAGAFFDAAKQEEGGEGWGEQDERAGGPGGQDDRGPGDGGVGVGGSGAKFRMQSAQFRLWGGRGDGVIERSDRRIIRGVLGHESRRLG